MEDTTSKVATALLPLADGTFLVGGYGDEFGWVGRFDGSGKQLWLETIASMTEGLSWTNLLDLTTDGQDGCWALSEDSGKIY